MSRIMNYIDDLMMNQPLNSEEMYTPSSSGSFGSSETSNEYFHGGRYEPDEPTGLGGFPPIYVCDKKEVTESPFEDESKPKREYSKPKSTVSIANIMKERRNIKPFISLD